MPTDVIRGFECNVSLNAGAGYVRLINIKNVKFPRSANEINTTTRFDQDWEATAQGLKKFGMTCDMQFVKTDFADWDMVAELFDSGAVATLLAEDHNPEFPVTPGTRQVTVPVVVTQFDVDESEGNVRTASVTFRKARGLVTYTGTW